MRARGSARFSAKLLFQFKTCYAKGGCDRRRTCEERIISFYAENAQAALAHAKKVGRSSQTDYLNDRGDTVRFEFIGVMDLLQLGSEADTETVWYDIVERLLPFERGTRFLPTDRKLIQRASS